MKKNVIITCDLQFGSTGKGLLAGYLAEKEKPDTVITAWSPNAGHTYINSAGKKFVHSMLANGIVSPNLKRVMIGPGSVINLDKLKEEVMSCAEYLQDAELIIHENAAIVKPEHIEEENITMISIGSTKKGSGAALVEKIQRHNKLKIIAMDFNDTIKEKFGGHIKIKILDTECWLDHIDRSDKILVEGAQGFSLGINSGFYPYCTSRECTPAQIMSDNLIAPRRVEKIIGVMRTFPIRVANRYDEQGRMVGFSGPCYYDQAEMSWEDLNRKPEFTTVTKLKRRVFSFSPVQLKQSLKICCPDEVFLSFCDYISPEQAQGLKLFIDEELKLINGGDTARVKYMSYGPRVTDVREV